MGDEAVGGIVSAGRKFLPHSTPVENGAKIFMQGRSGSELNKAVNHGAKKQWSWAPSSRPNPKTDWGARSSRAIKKFFNKDVMEEAVGGKGTSHHARTKWAMKKYFRRL